MDHPHPNFRAAKEGGGLERAGWRREIHSSSLPQSGGPLLRVLITINPLKFSSQGVRVRSKDGGGGTGWLAQLDPSGG